MTATHTMTILILNAESPRMTRAKLIERYMTVYGPYAFGVVSLLVIWFTIVRPELARNQLDFDRQQSIVDTQREIASTQKQTAETLDRTAARLEAVTTRLELLKGLP